MTSSMHEDLIEDGKNKLQIVCQFCTSKMLSPQSANHSIAMHNLPFMTQKENAPSLDGEDISEFWVVDDMFTFENIGFTFTVDDIRYLSCADCEMGPVGYHIISTKKSYVALSRVKHQA